MPTLKVWVRKRGRGMTDVTARISPDLARMAAPKHTAKWLQRSLGVSWHTARSMLRDGISDARRARFAEALEREAERLESNIQRLRREAQLLRQDDDG